MKTAFKTNVTNKMSFDGARKRFGPTVVVGDTLRRVKWATDECVGPGTYWWGYCTGGWSVRARDI